jgi:hypothetical protein
MGIRKVFLNKVNSVKICPLCPHNLQKSVDLIVFLGGLVLSVLGIRPKIRGFEPGRERWTFKCNKIRSTTSFGGEVKPSATCRKTTAC